MPREFDPEDDVPLPDYDQETEPPFPGAVRLAGILWLGFGILELLNALANLAVAFSRSTGASPAPESGIGGCMCATLFGGAFIFVGQQTLRGTAGDTIGNAVGSMVFGLLILAAGVALVAGSLGAPNSADVPLLAAVGVFSLAAGIGLELAGILALVGRGKYRAWRQWQRDRARRGDGHGERL